MAAATLGCHYIPGSFLASPSTNSKSLRNGNRQTVQLGGINRKLFRGLKVGSLKKNNEEQRRSFIMASQEPNTEGHGGAMKVVNTGDGGSKLVIDHDKEKELRGQGKPLEEGLLPAIGSVVAKEEMVLKETSNQVGDSARENVSFANEVLLDEAEDGKDDSAEYANSIPMGKASSAEEYRKRAVAGRKDHEDAISQREKKTNCQEAAAHAPCDDDTYAEGDDADADAGCGDGHNAGAGGHSNNSSHSNGLHNGSSSRNQESKFVGELASESAVEGPKGLHSTAEHDVKEMEPSARNGGLEKKVQHLEDEAVRLSDKAAKDFMSGQGESDSGHNGSSNGSSSRNQESKFVGELASESAVEGPKGLHSTAEHDVKEMEPSARNGGLEKKVQHLEDAAVRSSDKAAKDFMSGQGESGSTSGFKSGSGYKSGAPEPVVSHTPSKPISGQSFIEKKVTGGPSDVVDRTPDRPLSGTSFSDQPSVGGPSTTVGTTPGSTHGGAVGAFGGPVSVPREEAGNTFQHRTKEGIQVDAGLPGQAERERQKLSDETSRGLGKAGDKAQDVGDKARGATQEVKERLPEDAQRATDRVGEKAEELGDKAKGAAQDVKERLPESAQRATDKAGEKAEELGDNTKGAARTVGHKAEQLGEKAKGAAREVQDCLPDGAKAATQKVGREAEKLGDRTKEQVEHVKEEMPDNAREAGVKARQTTEHAAEEVKGGLSEVMEHVVNPLAQAVKEVITDPGSLFHPNAGHEDEHKHKK